MKSKLHSFIILPLLFCSGCSPADNPEPIKNNQFVDATLDSKTFVYDGYSHSLEVTGAPEGTNIVYTNNNQKDVGTYTVVAELSKEGYDDKTLNATLTITAKLFEGVSFLSKTFDYDEKAHSLEVTGAPEGTNISYTNNKQTEVGTYTVTAKLSKTGYVSKTLTATLTIKGLTFNEAKLEGKTFAYDGKPHSLEVTGAPEGTNIVYSNNNKTNVGTYTVTAKLSKSGYENKTLTATLIISNEKVFPDGNFEDLYFIYDNRDIALNEFFSNYEYKLRYVNKINYSVIYKVNGATKTEPKIKNVGEYNISAIYSATGYITKTISFKITISDQIGGVDQTKTPYQFTMNSKFKDLYNEIKKANYSVKRRYYDEYDYDKDGTFETIKDSPNVSNYFVTPEAFAGRHNEDSTQYSTKDYFISKGTNYAYNCYFDYHSLSRYKFPVSNYLETVISISGGMLPFTLLKESDDGGFENSKIGGYHDSYGSFVIDTENNQLIITSRCYYEHTEFNHNEVNEYIFYNIGNTTVSLPDEMKGDDSKQNLFTTDMFIENGVSYTSYETEDGKIAFCADVTLNECDDAYLGGIVCILKAEIDGAPVSQIDYDYYYNKFYVDHSKYQINVYYDDDGYYQGIYEGLGKVKYYLDARKYGDIRYYGEWEEQS